MKIRQLVWKTLVVALTALLVSCASVSVHAESQPPRVYTGSCVFGVDDLPAPLSGESAILASIGSAAIKVGLDRLGKALRAAGEEQTTTLSALRNVEFTPGRADACIQFVAGGIGSSGECAPAAASSLSARCTKLKDAGIYLTSTPKLFLELQLRHSETGAAYTVSPTFLSYQDKLKGGKRKKGESRGLVVQARFHGPGISANGKGSVGGAVVLGDVAVGTERTYEFPHGGQAAPKYWELESPWFPALNPPIKDMPKPDSQDATDPEHPSNAMMPLTITVSVSETRSARPFYLFLADVFDESKEELQVSAEKLVLESKREEAELAAFTAAQTALANADEKRVAAELAIVKYCSANYSTGTAADRESLALTNSGSARAAQIGANIASRSTGQSEVYPVLISISRDAPVVGVTPGC